MPFKEATTYFKLREEQLCGVTMHTPTCICESPLSATAESWLKNSWNNKDVNSRL